MGPRLIVSRRWLRSWDPERVDWLVALVLLAVLETRLWAASGNWDRGVAGASAVLLAIAVAVRRRWLVQVLAVGVLSASASLVVEGSARGPGGGAAGLVAVMLLFYAAGAFYAGWRSWLALGLGVAVLLIANAPTSASQAGGLLLVLGAGVLGPFLVGRMARDHAARERASRERAERLDSERELRVRTAALAERARLAREIHDVIAHSVSVMVIQAAGARTVMDGDLARAEASLRAVELAGREALAELRRLLGVLGDGPSLRALAPQPGLADLTDLVARANAAGVPATISVEGEPIGVAPGLSLCAYRVVQEALTNAIKHAAPARAQVSVRWRAEALELVVADDGSGADAGAPRPDAGGHGIVGMRERVALHGGTLSAGPAPGGGFAVQALIPLASEAPA